MEVLENKYHIEILETKLNTFQMGDFDVVKSDDHKRRLSELDQAVCRRLTENIRAKWDAIEAKLAKWNVNVHVIILSCICDFPSKCLKLLVKISTTSPFFLLSLKFFLVAVSVFPFAISSLIKLYISSFTVKLNIFGFFFAD